MRHISKISGVFFAVLLLPTVVAAQSAQQTFDQNMKDAQKAYERQKNESDKQKMKEYQKDAGNFVPGTLDKKIGKDQYISPSYKNGAGGGTYTKTF